MHKTTQNQLLGVFVNQGKRPMRAMLIACAANPIPRKADYAFHTMLVWFAISGRNSFRATNEGRP